MKSVMTWVKKVYDQTNWIEPGTVLQTTGPKMYMNDTNNTTVKLKFREQIQWIALLHTHQFGIDRSRVCFIEHVPFVLLFNASVSIQTYVGRFILILHWLCLQFVSPQSDSIGDFFGSFIRPTFKINSVRIYEYV